MDFHHSSFDEVWSIWWSKFCWTFDQYRDPTGLTFLGFRSSDIQFRYNLTKFPWALIGNECQHIQNVVLTLAPPNNYRKASKFLEWTCWKSRFNTALILDKKHLFVQEYIKRPRANKQVQRNQNASTFFLSVAHGCPRINILQLLFWTINVTNICEKI